MDNLVKKINVVENNLEPVDTALNFDKEIYLLRAFEVDESANKKYMINAGILVENILLTSTFADTVHFMEELYLFDTGNDQNKYLDITEYKNTKNLKLKVDNDSKIFISKSEARAMYKLFNLSLMGYAMARILEFEHRFAPQNLTQLLHKHKMLKK